MLSAEQHPALFTALQQALMPHLQQHHTPQQWWLVRAPSQLLAVDLLHELRLKRLLLLLRTCRL
jgi:hypothetical protein